MLELESFRIDLARRAVEPRGGGEPLVLTTREADLLGYLTARPSQIVTRDELIAEVWGYADNVVSRACDTTMRRLRTKIEANPTRPVHLLTVHGAGYQFEPCQTGSSPSRREPAVVPRRRLCLGPVVVDFGRLRVIRPNGEAVLTAKEAAILDRLWSANGAGVERQALIREVWGRGSRGALASAIFRLRTKIELDPSAPTFLQTAGSGYRLAVPSVAVRGERDRFVGRVGAIDRLRAAIDGGRWTLITGTGGVGKTRLARRVSAELGIDAVWVDATPATSADGLVAAVATSLGVPIGYAAPTSLAAALSSRGPCLVVLDNLEQCRNHVAPLVDALTAGAPELRLLGTSRVRLGLPGEGVVELEPMDLDDAVTLFADRARSASRSYRWSEAERPAVEALCEALDRLPLAIELAAARTPVLTPDGIRVRLRARLDLLAQPRAAVERHASLRAAISGSFTALSPPEAEALQILALFRSGFSAEAAEAVLGGDAIDRLQALRDSSLVHDRRGDPARFDLLEAIRAGADEARASAPDGGRRLELAWVEPLACLARRDEWRPWKRDLRHLAQAHGDLLLAAELAARWGEPDLAAGCVVGAVATIRQAGVSPILQDLADRLEQDPRMSVDALLSLWRAQAVLGSEADDPHRTIRAAEASLRHARDPVIRGFAHWDLSVGYDLLNEAERRVAHAALAGEAFVAAGIPHLAAARLQAGDGLDPTDAALLDWHTGIRLAEEAGDQRMAAALLLQLAWIRSRRGEFGAARRSYERAIVIYQQEGDWIRHGLTISRLAFVLAMEGEHQVLDDLIEAVLPGLRARGVLNVQHLLGIKRVESFMARGLLVEAEAALAEARRTRPTVGTRGRGLVEMAEAELRLNQGDPATAAALAQDAREQMTATGDQRNARWANAILGLALALAGDREEAGRCADAAIADLGRIEVIQGAGLLTFHGRIAAALGDRVTAERDLAEVEAVADRTRVREGSGLWRNVGLLRSALGPSDGSTG